MKITQLFPLSRNLLALGLAIFSTLATAQSTPTADPRGRWITASGNLEVEVSPCGAALCGSVTKVLGNRSMSRDGAAMEPVDTRPALGMTLLKDFVPVDAGENGAATTQWKGEIYNRENGKNYHCRMSMGTTPEGRPELVLHAYIGIPIFGKTQRWQRVVSGVSASTQH
ncbi:MAG: DUF2147 domain-containing protein [Pseudomonadota bacterium]